MATGMEENTGTVILLPVFDDWEALTLLLGRLPTALGSEASRSRVLIVDDGSRTPPPPSFPEAPRLGGVEVLRLRRNLGHQRAIAVGLSYVGRTFPGSTVVVMDADGEDDPADVPRLLRQARSSRGERVVFAERRRRSESPAFRILYHAYRLVHLVLTGIPVRVGNFSAIPASQLERLLVVSELWNHYAAAVFASHVAYETIPTSRSQRLAGKSRMNLVSLVGHGLQALSVHSEIIGTRLLIAASLAFAASTGGLLVGVAAVLRSAGAMPAWLPAFLLLLVVLSAQAFLIALVAVFVTLRGRSSATFLPIRDAHWYVASVEGQPPVGRQWNEHA